MSLKIDKIQTFFLQICWATIPESNNSAIPYCMNTDENSFVSNKREKSVQLKTIKSNHIQWIYNGLMCVSVHQL